MTAAFSMCVSNFGDRRACTRDVNYKQVVVARIGINVQIAAITAVDARMRAVLCTKCEGEGRLRMIKKQIN